MVETTMDLEKTLEKIQNLNLQKYGRKYCACLHEVKMETIDKILSVSDVFDIMEKHYGKKLESMKPKTIFKKMLDLMGLVWDFCEHDENFINEIKCDIKDKIEYFVNN